MVERCDVVRAVVTTTVDEKRWCAGDAAEVGSVDVLCHAAAEVVAHDPDLALTYLDHAAELCGKGSARHSEVTLRRSVVLCTLQRVSEAVVAIDEALTAEHDPKPG